MLTVFDGNAVNNQVHVNYMPPTVGQCKGRLLYQLKGSLNLKVTYQCYAETN